MRAVWVLPRRFGWYKVVVLDGTRVVRTVWRFGERAADRTAELWIRG